ncbi:hypothetical protein [Veronia nyctiphanis]|uniref:hypothetical protein n=1 Tax=Veronia nyctiphanis TaxID=1278244 RepID=UPI00100AAA8E|nr:hypothetical protein [Veronia nyctiphanis]
MQTSSYAGIPHGRHRSAYCDPDSNKGGAGKSSHSQQDGSGSKKRSAGGQGYRPIIFQSRNHERREKFKVLVCRAFGITPEDFDHVESTQNVY